ncbi:MAG TPA: peptidoglycan DD-metalloendopeptidase family protein [Actinomycetota bacterium]|nr:peptidoglycan DD-metalloendopeptidase family protein [Actinomycetota bacterium]
MTARKAPRKLAPFVAVVLLAGLFTGSAGAQSTEEELAAAKKALAAAEREATAATAVYEKAYGRFILTEEKLNRTRSAIARARARVDRLQTRLAARAREAYVLGGSSTLELLLASDSFSEFSDRVVFLNQIAQDDVDLVLGVGVLSEQLRRHRVDLNQLSRRQAGTVDVLEEKKQEIYAKLEEAQVLRDKLGRKLATELAVASIITASGSTNIIPGAVLEACPGPGTSFVDSWGAPRSGGRRHEGVDMMAGYGTPVYAAQSGTVAHSSSGLGGLTAYVYGDSGDTTMYMHLQGFSDVPAGAHVSAGDLIAYIGDSGNAAGSPHLHFEYHPGGGAAVNPYPYVLAVC